MPEPDLEVKELAPSLRSGQALNRVKGASARRVLEAARHYLDAVLRRPELKRALLIALSLAVLLPLFLSLYQERALLGAWLAQIRLETILLSFGLYSVALGLAVYAWGGMIDVLSHPVGVRRHFRIFCLTHLARRLPGVLWHVVGRVVWYQQEGVPKSVVSLASALEQVLIILAGFVTYAMTLPAALSSVPVSPVVWVVGLAAGAVLIHPRTLRAILRRLGQAEQGQALRYRHMVAWFGSYVLGWVAGGLILAAVVGALRPLNETEVVALVGAWGLSGALGSLAVFSPSGLGIREVSLTLLLAPLLSVPQAAFVAVFMRVLTTGLELAWALIAWRV